MISISDAVGVQVCVSCFDPSRAQVSAPARRVQLTRDLSLLLRAHFGAAISVCSKSASALTVIRAL